MTREYVFVMNLERVRRKLVPARDALLKDSNCVPLKKLGSEVSDSFAKIPRDSQAAQMGRLAFLLGLYEFAFHCVTSIARAKVEAQNELIPELIEALCLEEIWPGRAMVDQMEFKAVQWLCNESSAFNGLFYAHREAGPVTVGEGSSVFFRNGLLATRSALIAASVPREQDDRQAFVSLIDRVLADATLALGIAAL